MGGILYCIDVPSNLGCISFEPLYCDDSSVNAMEGLCIGNFTVSRKEASFVLFINNSVSMGS